MVGLLLRAIVFVFIGVLLTSCGNRPRQVVEVQQIYEIRALAVTANAGISPRLMVGIKQRLDKAIHDTARPMPMPRAVMNIHVVDVSHANGYDGHRTQTEISVALTDVPSGQPVLVRSFLVYSFSLSERGADDAAAEAIAARLRVEFALAQPVIRDVQDTTPRLSTRMRDDDQPRLAKREKSIVVPLKTAPVIGADQDPILNSKTKVEPAEKQAVEPAISHKIVKPAPAENALESGAKAKVVIRPKPATTEPASDEPCVETMDKKC